MLTPRVPTMDTRTAKPTPKTADAELLSAEWRMMRTRVIRETGGRCQHPGCGKTERRMYIDHIVERRDEGSLLDRSNLQCLCPRHHAMKTNAERAKRARA